MLAVAPSNTFSMLDGWDGMPETLPFMYAITRRILAMPATSYDVERCVSSLKWLHDEWHQEMKEETHCAAWLLHFNGME